MRTNNVLDLLRGIENVADRYLLRAPGTSDFNAGRVEVAAEIKKAISDARDIVERIGVEAYSGMPLFEFAATIKAMRDEQQFAAKNPTFRSRRPELGRRELRVDFLVNKILADKTTNMHIYLPFK